MLPKMNLLTKVELNTIPAPIIGGLSVEQQAYKK